MLVRYFICLFIFTHAHALHLTVEGENHGAVERESDLTVKRQNDLTVKHDVTKRQTLEFHPNDEELQNQMMNDGVDDAFDTRHVNDVSRKLQTKSIFSYFPQPSVLKSENIIKVRLDDVSKVNFLLAKLDQVMTDDYTSYDDSSLDNKDEQIPGKILWDDSNRGLSNVERHEVEKSAKDVDDVIVRDEIIGDLIFNKRKISDEILVDKLPEEYTSIQRKIDNDERKIASDDELTRHENVNGLNYDRVVEITPNVVMKTTKKYVTGGFDDENVRRGDGFGAFNDQKQYYYDGNIGITSTTVKSPVNNVGIMIVNDENIRHSDKINYDEDDEQKNVKMVNKNPTISRLTKNNDRTIINDENTRHIDDFDSLMDHKQYYYDRNAQITSATIKSTNKNVRIMNGNDDNTRHSDKLNQNGNVDDEINIQMVEKNHKNSEVRKNNVDENLRHKYNMALNKFKTVNITPKPIKTTEKNIVKIAHDVDVNMTKINQQIMNVNMNYKPFTRPYTTFVKAYNNEMIATTQKTNLFNDVLTRHDFQSPRIVTKINTPLKSGIKINFNTRKAEEIDEARYIDEKIADDEARIRHGVREGDKMTDKSKMAAGNYHVDESEKKEFRGKDSRGKKRSRANVVKKGSSEATGGYYVSARYHSFNVPTITVRKHNFVDWLYSVWFGL